MPADGSGRGDDRPEAAPRSPFADLVGPVEVTGTSPATYRVVVGPQCANTLGRAHGGFLAALVDITTTRGTREALTDGRSVVTATTTTDFLGPARVGDVLDVEVTVDRDTPKLVFSSCRLSVEGRPVARATVVLSTRQ